jgi:ubiquinone/menaquinone biosynthesis C-methylase UbiE
MSLPKGYVDPEYLQVVGELFAQLKQRTYGCMKIQPGHKVLDVGCGPATDTISLAQLAGSTGEVAGIDYDEAMVAEADQRAEKAGVKTWVRHKRADASALPFESEYFDACRSERLFQHLPNPAQALSEMTRVTKTNGQIVVLDTDWGTTSIDTDEVDLERKLTRFVA